MAGVSWRAKIVPIRALDSRGFGDTATLARAFTEAVRLGIPIVNASLGGPPSEVVADAIELAPDTLFVVAAGNGGRSIDERETYPCAYIASFPASAPSWRARRASSRSAATDTGPERRAMR